MARLDNKNQNSFKIIATTLSGLEEVLGEELKNLGANDIKVLNRAVEFTGDIKLIYKANLSLSCAIRILVPIKYFYISSQRDFYYKLRNFDWDIFLSADQSFSVHSNISNSIIFNNSHFVSLRAKDAIVDYYKYKNNNRPNVDIKSSDVKFYIHINSDELVTLMIDSTGEALYKRGYRKEAGEAPLNEVLAAGMVLLSSWNKTDSLLDPFCGSGTILIEAYHIATKTPVNLNRKKFNFMGWRDFDSKLFINLKRELVRNIQPIKCSLIGQDINHAMIHKAINNTKNIQFSSDEIIDFEVKDFWDEAIKNNFQGSIITNPPYGNRLDCIDFKSFGDKLKNDYANSIAWVLIGDDEISKLRNNNLSNKSNKGLKSIGLKASKKYRLMNGSWPCTYAKFDLFSGKHSKYTKDKIAKI